MAPGPPRNGLVTNSDRSYLTPTSLGTASEQGKKESHSKTNNAYNNRPSRHNIWSE
ncbi:5924_t:CDS:2, partial [Cetraspora pellucida]